MTDYTNLLRMLKTYEDGYGLYQDAAAAIEALQAQLPKRGEWKITTEHFTPELICSKCGVHIPCVAGWCMDAHMNYCPNCGAKMEFAWWYTPEDDEEVQDADTK